MRKLAFAAAIAAASIASPALAGGYATLRLSHDATEVQIEEGGADVSENTGKGIGFGFAVGYDFDLGSAAFVGIEAGIDESTASRSTDIDGDTIEISAGREISGVARFGLKPSEAVKLYGLVGYADASVKLSDSGVSESDSKGGLVYGAGIGYNFSDKIGASLEYRRLSVDGGTELESDLFVDDINFNKSRILVGLSYRF